MDNSVNSIDRFIFSFLCIPGKYKKIVLKNTLIGVLSMLRKPCNIEGLINHLALNYLLYWRGLKNFFMKSSKKGGDIHQIALCMRMF